MNRFQEGLVFIIGKLIVECISEVLMHGRKCIEGR
jgi:hypothetical protein